MTYFQRKLFFEDERNVVKFSFFERNLICDLLPQQNMKHRKHVPESIAQRRVAYESEEKSGLCLRRRVSKEPASVFKILV